MQTLLRRKAQTDSLTGLKNKSTTEELCRTCLEHAQGDICALFILDLDNFKHINDERGHQAGDVAVSYTHLDVYKRQVEDQALTKEEYDTPGYWEQGARDIKAVIGKPIDAVFCGTDYLGTGRFETLYGPESQVIYFDRSEVPVCSTDIRAWALGPVSYTHLPLSWEIWESRPPCPLWRICARR